MKRPNISFGNWQAKLHRDMTPPRTKVETRDAVICDTLGNEADAIACAAVPDLLEALERCLPDWHAEDDPKEREGKIAGEISIGDMRAIKAALTKAGYTF